MSAVTSDQFNESLHPKLKQKLLADFKLLNGVLVYIIRSLKVVLKAEMANHLMKWQVFPNTPPVFHWLNKQIVPPQTHSIG